MKKFNIYAGMESEQFNLHVERGVELETVEEALEWAEDFGYDLYYMNPNRDILEIAKEDNVSEDEAELIFIKEMTTKVIFFVKEIVEINGEVIEEIEHRSI